MFSGLMNILHLEDEYEEDFDGEYEEAPARTKKSFIKKDLHNSEEDYEEESASVSNRQQAKPKSAKQGKIIPMRGVSTSEKPLEVCLIKPKSVEDGRSISDTLLAGCAVILNLEGLQVSTAQRIIDFSSGACYSMNGNLQRVSNYIFLITPESVEISGDFQELLNSDSNSGTSGTNNGNGFDVTAYRSAGI